MNEAPIINPNVVSLQIVADLELEVIGTIIREMKKLEVNQQQRVINYIGNRFGYAGGAQDFSVSCDES